jgi:hypothetical protein
MNLGIRFPDQSELRVPIYPTTTYRALYDSVLKQLPQGSSGYLVINRGPIPYNDTPIDYNDIARVGFLRFIPTKDHTAVDDQYDRLGRRIQDLGSIYFLWRQGDALKQNVKSSSDAVKEAIDTLIKEVNAVPQ